MLTCQAHNRSNRRRLGNPDKFMKVTILARKDLKHNTRVLRQAEALCNSGVRVHVVSLTADLPVPNHSDRHITHTCITLYPAHQRLPNRLEALTERFMPSNDTSPPRSEDQKDRTGAKGTLLVPMKHFHAMKHGVRFFLLKTSNFISAKAPSPLKALARMAAPIVYGFVNGMYRLMSMVFHLIFRLWRAVISSIQRIRVLGRNLARDLRKYRIKGVRIAYKIIRSTSLAFLRPFAQSLTTLDFALRAYHQLKDEPSDVVQAHDSFALLGAYLLARRHGAKLVYDAVEIAPNRSATRHGRFGTWVGHWVGRLWEGCCVRRADLVLTPTPVISEVLKQRYGADAQLIMNCTWYEPPEALQVDKPDGIRKQIGTDPDDPLVLYVGAISAENGIDYLLKSLRHLPEPIHIVLMGPMQARYEERLNALIQAEAIGNRVSVLPPVPPNRVVYYAADADVGVVAYQKGALNNTATLPNKFFMYLMARLPIVAARFPAMRTIIEKEGIGCLYEPSNVEDMARAIRESLEPDNHDRMKRNLDRAARTYSWEREAETFVSLYQGLAG